MSSSKRKIEKISSSSSPADDVFGYMGKGQAVPKDVVSVRFHPSVIEVDDDAFRNCKQLREVILNDGLLRIGSQAFEHCSSLVSITFPSSLATFDYGVFLNCKSLKRVVFNEGLRKIGNDAFRNTALQSISIPSTVIKIGNYAFSNCKSLTEIVLNEGLKEIGGDAFSFCRSLQSIILPSTVTKIGITSFGGCSNLREVVLNEGLIEISDWAFVSCQALRSITIPSTVVEICSRSFDGCANLRDVVLNNGIKKIGQSAFSFTSLEHITIPSSVIEIGEHAFSHCTNLREVVTHNEKIQIGDKAFLGCALLERFSFPSLSTRLDDIIQAGQRGIQAKMDDIPAVEWRGGELSIPAIRREINLYGMETVAQVDVEKLNRIKELIFYHEMKEATTLFELALWKAGIDQADISNADRGAYRVDVPGPVKDTILQYLN
jgi:hypothetical protein